VYTVFPALLHHVSEGVTPAMHYRLSSTPTYGLWPKPKRVPYIYPKSADTHCLYLLCKCPSYFLLLYLDMCNFHFNCLSFLDLGVFVVSCTYFTFLRFFCFGFVLSRDLRDLLLLVM